MISELVDVIKVQGHSFTLVQGHSDSKLSNFFSLETSRPIEAKFHVEPPWDGVMKVNTNGLCHQNGRHVHIWVKTFKNLLLWNQKAADFDSSCVALIAQMLPTLFKWWPWVDFDLFYGKVKFGPFYFCMGMIPMHSGERHRTNGPLVCIKNYIGTQGEVCTVKGL